MGGELLVYVGGQAAPADSEWAAYARLAAELAQRTQPDASLLRICVFVDDGTPNAKQRALLAEALRGVSVRAAVVTTSAFARRMITVFSWLGADMRGFTPAELPEVASYLEMSGPELRATVETAEALAAAIGGVQAVASATGLST